MPMLLLLLHTNWFRINDKNASQAKCAKQTSQESLSPTPLLGSFLFQHLPFSYSFSLSLSLSLSLFYIDALGTYLSLIQIKTNALSLSFFLLLFTFSMSLSYSVTLFTPLQELIFSLTCVRHFHITHFLFLFLYYYSL